MSIGLVTGSAPFAGLPDNPASDLLGRIDGAVIGGVTIRTAQIPVSRARLPAVIGGLIEEHRPDFYVSLGLATGAPVLRFETTAINRVDFGVADNEGDAAHRWRPDRRRRSGCAFRDMGRRGLARTLVEATTSRPSCLASRGDAFVQPRALYRSRRDGAGRAAGAGRVPASALHAQTGGALPPRRAAGGRPRAADAAGAAVHAARDAGGGAAPGARPLAGSSDA
jgi:hypothetical protein